MVKKYLIKRSQAVAIVVFLIEIMGAFILAQIDSNPKRLCDAVTYCYFFEREVEV